MIWLSRILNVIATIGAAASTASIAGQLPANWTPYVSLVALIGTLAAKWAKTPSPAIAAAVPKS